MSSLGSQTEFRLAERGNGAVISSARFVPCLQDICVRKKNSEREREREREKREREREKKENFMAVG